MNIGQSEPKLSIFGSLGKIYVGFLVFQKSGTSDKWKCLVLWIAGQVRDLRQVVWTSLFIWNPCLFSFDKKPLSVTKKDFLPCIRQTECDMDSRIKLKVFKEMGNEFRTKNNAWRLFAENYCLKKIISVSYRTCDVLRDLVTLVPFMAECYF